MAKKILGFTFIEVLISLLIVSLVLGSMVNFSVNNSRKISNLQITLWSRQIAWNNLIAIFIKPEGNLSEQNTESIALGHAWVGKIKLTPTVTKQIEKVESFVGAEKDDFAAKLSIFILKTK